MDTFVCYWKRVFLLIVLLFECINFVGSSALLGCKRKPPICQLLPDDPTIINGTYVVSEIEKSLVSFTPNQTRYEGQMATFVVWIDQHRSDLEVTPVAFVGECEADLPLCLEQEYNKTTGLVGLKCTFTNLTVEFDDGKEIQFYGLAIASGEPIKVCFGSSSHLSVFGPVNATVSIDRCQGLLVQVNSVLGPNTTLKCHVYGSDDQLLNSSVHASHPVTSSSPAVIVIPPEIVTDHIGQYRIELVPVIIASDGPTTSLTVDLHDSKAIMFHISDISLHVDAHGHFSGIVDILVNTACILTIPNLVHVSAGSCSERQGGVIYPVTMNSITDSGLFTIIHPLLPNKHDCTFAVGDDVGNNHTFNTNISTFHTQSCDMNVQEASSTVQVKCGFLPGTTANGCWVTVVDIEGITVEEQLFHAGSFGYVELGPFDPGSYTIIISDSVKGVKGPVPVFRRAFSVNPTSTPVASSSASSMLPSSSSFDVIDDDGKGGTHTVNNDLVIPLSCVSVIAVVLVCVIIGLLLVVLFIQKKRMNPTKNSLRAYHNEDIPGIQTLDSAYFKDRSSITGSAKSIPYAISSMEEQGSIHIGIENAVKKEQKATTITETENDRDKKKCEDHLQASTVSTDMRGGGMNDAATVPTVGLLNNEKEISQMNGLTAGSHQASLQPSKLPTLTNGSISAQTQESSENPSTFKAYQKNVVQYQTGIPKLPRDSQTKSILLPSDSKPDEDYSSAIGTSAAVGEDSHVVTTSKQSFANADPLQENVPGIDSAPTTTQTDSSCRIGDDYPLIKSTSSDKKK